MTVNELIQVLSELPPDMEVLAHDSISPDTIMNSGYYMDYMLGEEFIVITDIDTAREHGGRPTEEDKNTL